MSRVTSLEFEIILNSPHHSIQDLGLLYQHALDAAAFLFSPAVVCPNIPDDIAKTESHPSINQKANSVVDKEADYPSPKVMRGGFKPP